MCKYLRRSDLLLWLEINQLEHEIENHIHNLEAWMEPEAVGTDLINTIGGGKSVTPPKTLMTLHSMRLIGYVLPPAAHI